MYSRDESLDLFVESNLPYRWRLCSHPLYNNALENCGIAVPGSGTERTGDASNEENAAQLFGVRQVDFEKIKMPKAKNSQHTSLLTLFKNAVMSKTQTERTYKWVTCMVGKMSNILDNMANGHLISDFGSVPSLLPPMQRRKTKRVNNSDLVNRANRDATQIATV